MIPVVVLAGFLGSGKTTLLNHLLRTSGGTRIGVVVNDFGRINIDAFAVSAQVDSMVSLSNGCLCCAVDGTELDAMLEKLAAADLDVIVIEASGLAEPSTLVRMVLQAPGVTYGGLIYVVDAVEFGAVPHLDRDLALADLVVLNKVDRVSALPSLPCEAPVLPVSYGRIDPALLFEVRPPDMGPRQLSFDDLDDHSTHAHASYDSVSFESSDPMHPKLFMDFVRARPEGLFRAKGFVNFGTLSLSMHTVGGFVSFEETDHARTELVLIGTGIDADSLTDWLMACVADGPISDQDLLYVQRYLRRS
ncbi:CobW family GTP-binding protein [Lentzea flava]|uniref:Cobalamin biosynthesis protein CobW n=1 Tax=Lentzea flava TaxID=103732 RepID=A0ABQ2UFE4_9PSEU|nr:GTP-binding protein [Lentzea flava]MCP2198669.1 GTPase, G3E family [Lentzea flava]GGU29247.1 cobalamin biosynthesis protein CobW [Lentzea flava]